jgi:hypothetical protein
VLLVRRIRELLYSEGFTISGARNHLDKNLLETLEETENMPLSIAQIKAELQLIAELLK